MRRDITVSAGIFGVALGLLAAWMLRLSPVAIAYAAVGLILFGALHAWRAQTRRTRHRVGQRWER